MSKPSMEQIARSSDLWGQYVDPEDATPFDSLTFDERMQTQVELYPDAAREELHARVDDNDALAPYAGVIFYDWPEGAQHIAWALTADEDEIVKWAESVSIAE